MDKRRRFNQLLNDYKTACDLFRAQDRFYVDTKSMEVMRKMITKILEWYPIICREYDELRGVEHNPLGNYQQPFNSHADVLTRAYMLKLLQCP